MSKLTEDQQRAFGDRITELFQDPQTATALLEKNSGLDPQKRIASLTAKQSAAFEAEKQQTQTKAAKANATQASISATEEYYKEASHAAEALIAELSNDHPLSHQIRQIRGGMSLTAARGPKEATVK
jgi:hypothetical protein